ncbi:MAG: RNA 2'-phosphotransferase [Anaerolineae bacterium]|nr:RNA 2'-phosphotransferase [Anaerolineae bacterium]MDW8068323.1 RNA 2'-phosphotransferase [Anaerolineae bacterium]
MSPASARIVKLSKFLSLILRHQPERFGLRLDEEGWASLPEVLEILQGLPNFRWATRADVMELVEKGSGDEKRRFEVVGERIRARYGHTIPLCAAFSPCLPPPRLYHGTSPHALNRIRKEGLRPMRRQYVHLSTDREAAARVGARHAPHPVVLIVRAREAAEAGILFHRADESTYLAKAIPPEFLEFPEEE